MSIILICEGIKFIQVKKNETFARYIYTTCLYDAARKHSVIDMITVGYQRDFIFGTSLVVNNEHGMGWF